MNGPVVVGVDGSIESLQAVDLAAREACWHDQALQVVHAFVWPMLHVPLGRLPGAPERSGLRAGAERIVAEAEARALRTCPGSAVSAAVIDGSPEAVLTDLSFDASLIVLGHRGLGAVTGALVGSVALDLVSRAGCPVLVRRGCPARSVTPHPSREPLPVVVGIDGSPDSQAALEVAVHEAGARGTRVIAVHAWTGGRPVDRLGAVAGSRTHRVAQDADRLLAESVAGWAERRPDVPIERRPGRGRADHLLINESAGADLLVVGARGRRLTGPGGLGSTSTAAVRHSPCPVIVVGPRAQRSGRRGPSSLIGANTLGDDES